MNLLDKIKACRHCEHALPLEPKPILQLGAQSKIVIAGQAPGLKAHERGIPFKDQSGDRLRQWLALDEASFYDSSLVSIIPMGFCYPGTGKQGDLPPRPECKTLWQDKVNTYLSDTKLTIIIGQYALKHYLKNRYSSVTDAVKDYQNLAPELIVLPHPSGRNNRWLKQHPWFERDVIPYLQARVNELK